MFNSMIYQVDDLDWTKSPKSHVFSWEFIDPQTKVKTPMKTNMIEYYQLKYNLRISSKDEK
jgi:hypothetical protein